VSNNHTPTSFTKRCKRFVTLFFPLGKSALLPQRSPSRPLAAALEMVTRPHHALNSPLIRSAFHARTFGKQST
jgi:hypothetical protein